MRTRISSRTVILLSLLPAFASSALTGCASKPRQSGFISDYSNLKEVDSSWMRYVSPTLKDYSAFIVDPIEIRVQRGALDDTQRAEVAIYAREAVNRALKGAGYRIATDPGVGIARVRMAITDIQQSTWWLNIHPATKLTGTGRAGASMELEVIDSVTGAQLGAAIRAGKGDQFELSPFSTVSDVKSVIDQWAESATERFKELRAAKATP